MPRPRQQSGPVHGHVPPVTDHVRAVSRQAAPVLGQGFGPTSRQAAPAPLQTTAVTGHVRPVSE
ncbi:hypothetical protein [Streptomyces collinus]|uniref:hypothetical protein n=1 Tax=Streptomyces collinus TaxID=42684 RepID=UPI003641BB4C